MPKNFFFSFSAYYFWKVLYIIFQRLKVKKNSQNNRNHRNQGFSCYICLMIEVSGSGSRAGSGFTPLTNGSGSGSRRLRNMWIRWIRIRIRNTGDPGCSSRIRIMIFYPSRIPDPGVKKASDPESGSATLRPMKPKNKLIKVTLQPDWNGKELVFLDCFIYQTAAPPSDRIRLLFSMTLRMKKKFLVFLVTYPQEIILSLNKLILC
jgi:hypothetical protein